MRRFAIASLWLSAICVWGGDVKGVRPRHDHTRYPVVMFNESVAIAAEWVEPEKVRRQLGSDLDVGYVVVEIGVYPRDHSTIQIKPSDFTLRVNRTRETLSAANPSVIALAVNAGMSARALPETSTDKPVAGYLYFPVKEKRFGNHEYELEYNGHSVWMILPLQFSGPR